MTVSALATLEQGGGCGVPQNRIQSGSLGWPRWPVNAGAPEVDAKLLIGMAREAPDGDFGTSARGVSSSAGSSPGDRQRYNTGSRG